MDIRFLLKISSLLIFSMLVTLVTVSPSFARGGSVYVYYGTDATAGEYNCGGNTCLNPSGNGTGGSVRVDGYNVSSSDYQYFSSNGTYPIVITPNSSYKVSSATLYQFDRTYYSWRKISGKSLDIDSPATSSTTDSVTLDASKYGTDYYLLVVKFSDLTNRVSYSVDSDVTATPATNCKSTAIITPTSPAVVADGNTQAFVISNTDSACSVYSIDYAGSGATQVTSLAGWNSATNTFTTPAIYQDTSFIIKYKKTTYQVTTQVDASGSNCGSISPNTSIYGAGSNQVFTLSTPSGCGIESFTDNGTDVKSQIVSAGVSNSYTLSGISADHTLIVKFVTISTSTGAAYCQVPPFMDGQSILKPNVLLIFDTSGSMACGAYYKNNNESYCPSSKTYNCTDTSTLSNCTNFYGYFEKDKTYKLSGNTYTIDTTATQLKLGSGSSSGLSGNYLNYKHMRRVDVIRKILIGGKVSSTVGSARTAPTGGSNIRYLQTHNGYYVEYGTTNPTGLVDQVSNSVRLGLMVFNPNSEEISTDLDSDGARLISEIGSSATTLIDNIENNTQPNGSTPLSESVYEGLRYFQGGESAYNSYNGSTKIRYNGTVTDAYDPHRVYAKPVQGSCQNNFMILLTDGAPTNDSNIPGQTAVSGWWHPVTVSSTVSDSSYTTWQSANSSSTPFPSNLLGKVSYYIHSYDLAAGQSTWGKAADPSQLQAIRLFNVFAFGDSTGASYLQEAAKFGAFLEDATVVGTNKDGKPNVNAEYISNAADPATTKGYYEADDGAVLQSHLTSIFENIVSTTASGTAAAVANNKSGQRGANMIQALFYPQFPTDTTKKWMGEVQALWYYLDPLVNYSAIYQDSNPDKILNLLDDALLPSNPYETKALWKAGAQLQLTSGADRLIYTPIDTSSLLTASSNEFSVANKTALKALLNVASLSDTQATDLIEYLRGSDKTVYRSRTVSFTNPSTGVTTTGVWKLGDIVNSTPIVQSSVALNSYNTTYSDSSYASFIATNDYKARNVVFTGSNDGMLHAFRLGSTSVVNDPSHPFKIAKLNGSDLGKEEWAFIPKNVLPYMQNQCGTDYCHQYLVDGAPQIVDASINIPTGCGETSYWNCNRKTTASSGVLDAAGTSWKTVLVGSMGLGGASRDSASSCNRTYDTVNFTDCVKTPVAGNGLSSYFALDVTNPLVPKYMWEFSDYSISDTSDKGLGFTTAGAAIVRINTGSAKNGRWFAILASGPTGSIDTTHRYFSGRSDQNLKLYIVDLNSGPVFTKCVGPNATGCNYWVKDTGIPYAFANSLNASAIDLDRWSQYKPGNFSDDVVYITYTKASLSSGYPSNSTAWNKGGVLRLVTNNDPDPYNWFTSKLIDDVGPITTSVARIQDRNKSKLWVFFGEGRYFYPGDERSTGTARKFYGVQDPCYDQYLSDANHALKTTAANCVSVNKSLIQDQSGDTPAATLTTGNIGWSVDMSTASGTSGDERVVSDVSATYNGLVFYTTYTPNTDVCTPGGVTSLWAVQYSSGGTPSTSALKGKAPIQTSSGGIKLIDLSTSFTQKGGRKLSSSLAPAGMAPKGKFPPLLSPKPSKQILQIREN